MKGSPAEWGGLTSGFFILSLGQVSLLESVCPVCLDERVPVWANRLLFAIVEWRKSKRDTVRLELMNRAGNKKVLSVNVDENFWPSWFSVEDAAGESSVYCLDAGLF
jgi:hypothetical protein